MVSRHSGKPFARHHGRRFPSVPQSPRMISVVRRGPEVCANERARSGVRSGVGTRETDSLLADDSTRLLENGEGGSRGDIASRSVSGRSVRSFQRDRGSFSMEYEEEEAPPAYTSPHNSLKDGEGKGGGGGSSDGLVRCLTRMMKLLKSMGGLIILLLAYTFLGAWIMITIEGPEEDAQKQEVFNVRESIAEQLKNNTGALQAGQINDTEWETRTSQMLLQLETTVHSSGVASTSKKKWTFFGGVLFCVTTYTTIGYGNIAPATKAGRIATMLYATIGIPLALIVLADLGRRFAIALKFVWSFIRRYYYTGYCRRIRGKIRKGSYDMNEAKVGMGNGDGFDDMAKEGQYKTTDRSDKDGGTYYKVEAEGGREDSSALLGKTDEKKGQSEASSLAASPRKDTNGDNSRRSQSVERVSNTNSSSVDHRGNTAKKDSAFIDPEDFNEDFKLPVLVAVGFIFAYIFLGAGMYTLWEKWTYLESFYFVFITTSTIGFGDVLPEHPNFFLLSCIYTFLGLALVSMTINVIMEWLAKTIDRAKEKVDQAKEKAVAKAKAAKGKLTEVGSRAKNKVLQRSNSKEGSASPQLKGSLGITDTEDQPEESSVGVKVAGPDTAREALQSKSNSQLNKDSTHKGEMEEEASQGPPQSKNTAAAADDTLRNLSELPTPSSDNEMSFRTATDFTASNDSIAEQDKKIIV